MKTYPIYLNNLAGRLCVVFGSNHESERKVNELLECDASVTVIHPELTEPMRVQFEAGAFAWRARYYQKGDLRGAFLAIASEPKPAINQLIWEEAEEERVLFNAMDDVPHCTFVAGSVVQQGPLKLTISTSGCAPALSVRLRQRFEKEFGPEYAEFLHLMNALRPLMKFRFASFEARRQIWYKMVDGPILEHIKAGNHDAVDALLKSYLGDDVLEQFEDPRVALQ